MTVSASLIFHRSVFQIKGAATEKALSPICFFLDGTARRNVSLANLVTGPILRQWFLYQKVCKINWSAAIMDFVNVKTYFKFNAFCERKPVKLETNIDNTMYFEICDDTKS